MGAVANMLAELGGMGQLGGVWNRHLWPRPIYTGLSIVYINSTLRHSPLSAPFCYRTLLSPATRCLVVSLVPLAFARLA